MPTRPSPRLTLLHIWARSGELDLLEAGLDTGGNPDVSSPCGWSPMHEAAAHGRAEAVGLLLSAGAPVDSLTLDGLSPLHLAASSGSFETLRALLMAGAKPNLAAPTGRTAIESALQNGHLHLVHPLLGAGAVIEGELAGLYVRALLKASGQRCQRTEDSSVEWAVDGMIHLPAGALLPIESELRSPVARAGKQRVQEIRLRSGETFATNLHFDFEGTDHLPGDEWRYRKGWTERAEAVLHGEVSPDLPCGDGFLPCLEAIRHGAPLVLRSLLEMGADPEQQPRYGCARGATLLHNAAEQGSPDLVTALLDARAQVDARSAADWTPLMVAASRGHCATIKALIRAGADVDARNAQGQTALLIARTRHHPDATRILLVAGNVNKPLPFAIA
jgi:ankyrin repeat protein